MDISTCKLCIILGDKDIKLVLVQVGMDGGGGGRDSNGYSLYCVYTDLHRYNITIVAKPRTWVYWKHDI